MMAEKWRPCEERREHTDEVDGSHPPIHWCRYLTRLLGMRTAVLPRGMCARCDRPALVEAVRAFDEWRHKAELGSVAEREVEAPRLWTDLLVIIRTALAALKLAKGEEARDESS